MLLSVNGDSTLERVGECILDSDSTILEVMKCLSCCMTSVFCSVLSAASVFDCDERFDFFWLVRGDEVLERDGDFCRPFSVKGESTSHSIGEIAFVVRSYFFEVFKDFACSSVIIVSSPLFVLSVNNVGLLFLVDLFDFNAASAFDCTECLDFLSTEGDEL